MTATTHRQLTLDDLTPRHAGKLGVLTLEQAREYQHRFHGVTTIASVGTTDPIVFFSDDHCYGYPHLKPCYVPTSTQLPHKVAPRPGLEDGWINTLEDYLKVFGRGARLITTREELLLHTQTATSTWDD